MKDETFYRASMDGTWESLENLRGHYAGTYPSSAWVVGGGPSLADADIDLINASPAPKMCVNYGGRGADGEGLLIRPDFWTTYDPTSRFSRHVFLNPSIKKFCNGVRRRDLVPGGSEKVCDCPNMVLYNNENRGYADFIKPGGKVLNCLDSFIQAIDILYHLGFRTIYCVGTDLAVWPSESQIELARSAGVEYDAERMCVTLVDPKSDNKPYQSDLLADFVTACEQSGLQDKYRGEAALSDRGKCLDLLAGVDREKQYSFEETKSLPNAIRTDHHYFNNVQYLRQARKNLSMHGVSIISCSPKSRLNAYFENIGVDDADQRIRRRISCDRSESTQGKFTTAVAPDEGMVRMADIAPYGWTKPEEAIAEIAEAKPDSIQKEDCPADNDNVAQAVNMDHLERREGIRKKFLELQRQDEA